MDEYSWKKQFLNYLKTMSIVFMCIFIFILLCALFSNTDLEYKLKTLILFGIVFMAILGFPLIVFLFLFVINNIINGKKKIIARNDEYNRDVPKLYTPAMASLVLDLKVEVYQDYTATILDLYVKKYIDIVNDNGAIHFKLLKSEDEILKLQEHERYIYNCIKNKINFDENDFKTLLVRDTQNGGLISETKYKSKYKLIIMAIVYFIFVLLLYNVNKMLFWFLLLIPIIVVPIIAYMLQEEVNTKYKRTPKGNEEAKKIIALKQYIKDYTLISERDIDYVDILEEYIPYAVALGEAQKIEEFIANDNRYRNLIYGLGEHAKN